MKTFKQWLVENNKMAEADIDERGIRTSLGIYPPAYGVGQYPPQYFGVFPGAANMLNGFHKKTVDELMNGKKKKRKKSKKD